MRTDYPHFLNNETGFENEKKTFSDIMDEAVWLHGAELLYIVQTLNQPEPILGEHLGKRLEDGIPIRLWTEEIEEDFYVQDAGLFTKFGYTPEIGSATWWATCNYFEFFNIKPKEQDLIFYKKTSQLFEIRKVTLHDGFKLKIHSGLYNYDHTELADDVTDTDLITLKDLDDLDKSLGNEEIQAAEDAESVIDETKKDGLFD